MSTVTTEPSTVPVPPTDTAQTEDDGVSFVGTLYQLAYSPRNREQLMQMRGCLGRRDFYAPEAVDIVGPWLPHTRDDATAAVRNLDRTITRNYYLTGGLFAAWHVQNSVDKGADAASGNLGQSMARLARAGQASAARALMRDLAVTPRDHVGSALQPAVALLAREGLRINWADLELALTTRHRQQWSDRQRRWAEWFAAGAARHVAAKAHTKPKKKTR